MVDFDEVSTGAVWMDGGFIDWDDATTHVLSEVATFGAGVFEGIRTYPTEEGQAVFRLEDHLQRLENSAKLIGMDLEYSVEELSAAAREVLRRNDVNEFETSFYVRPSVGYGYHGIGNPEAAPVNTYIFTFPLGRLSGEDALTNGIEVMISPWRRLHSSQFPVQAKANGVYLMSLLSKQEAQRNGYDDALLLDMDGNLAEGADSNVFIVRDGVLYTPSLDSGILPGVTRRTLITLAQDHGYEVEKKTITTGELLTADEAFLCGTGVEVTPVTAVNTTTIGDGVRGPITEELQSLYLDLTAGEIDGYDGWLDHV
ncbi:branched-chain amino acid transaminase [Haladaptatus caseinilyticus]|uniref:branched-chain amino acid transaminase n=1 Tax=Haladaptatus caseinilyticus TaxID=2993314 RepID=UPI00224B3AFD|nr:branched-chain amino acid transaminase [Haladaptatus caseinilyticus]